MDLRIVKTRLQIKNAFLKLRARLMPENIKVKDICEEAQINKTTFYKHYADSMELSNEIDDSVIDSVVSTFPERDTLFESPREYVMGLLDVLECNSELLKSVFRGKRDVLCSKLEEKLHGLFKDKAKTEDDRINISFAVGGFVRIVNDYLFNETQKDIEKIIDYTTKVVERIIKHKSAIAARD